MVSLDELVAVFTSAAEAEYKNSYDFQIACDMGQFAVSEWLSENNIQQAATRKLHEKAKGNFQYHHIREALLEHLERF